MSVYWPEFLRLAIAHLVAVVCPGPDFAIVLRQSLRHGRRAAILTAIGIGCGICLHVTYSLLGIGLLIRSSHTAFDVLKFAGAAYLAWIGISSLRAGFAAGGTEPDAQAELKASRDPSSLRSASRSAWAIGFATNALNPKATLFFVAIFAALVSPRTPGLIKLGYGAWISLTTMAWFIFVACVFAREPIRQAFLRHRHWIDRAMGVIFLVFAASLVVATVR
jgi:RhtB (resistance to homoserine/threonine) family protein